MPLLISLALSGCSSVDTASSPNGLDITARDDEKQISHLQATIWGYYLFGFIPLASGDPAYIGTTSFFTDTVRLDRTMDMLSMKAKALGSNRLENVSAHSTSTGLWSFGLVWYAEQQISATAVYAKQ